MTEHLVLGAVAMLGAGVVTGYACGFFGIGGGVILVPTFLTLFPELGVSHDVVMHAAVGTCLALVVPASIASTRKHYKLGNVESRLLRTWLPWIAVGTVVGAVTIRYIGTRDLKIIFTVYMFLTTIYIAFHHVPAGRASGVPGRFAQASGGLVIGNLSTWLGLGGGTFTVPYFRTFHYPMKRSVAIASATGIVIGAGGAIGAIVQGWGAPGRGHLSLGYVDGIGLRGDRARLGPVRPPGRQDRDEGARARAEVDLRRAACWAVGLHGVQDVLRGTKIGPGGVPWRPSRN